MIPQVLFLVALLAGSLASAPGDHHLVVARGGPDTHPCSLMVAHPADVPDCLTCLVNGRGDCWESLPRLEVMP